MEPATIGAFHAAQSPEGQAICDVLRKQIDDSLRDAKSKIWHGHPVWFLSGNPIVGYSKPKDCIRLMFWGGADFGEALLQPGTGTFKDASARYKGVDEIDVADLKRWLTKSQSNQWGYKNVYKRKRRLERLTGQAGERRSMAGSWRTCFHAVLARCSRRKSTIKRTLRGR